MLSLKERVYNTICEIEYSGEYEKNWELFNYGIDILKDHNYDFEFNETEKNTLENIFLIMEGYL